MRVPTKADPHRDEWSGGDGLPGVLVHEPLVAISRDLITKSPIVAYSADIGHEDARFSGDVRAHIPGSAPTIRQAARVLGAHHNSVRHRVTLAERELGLSISDTYGRSQLFMGLMLRRLRETYPLVNADV